MQILSKVPERHEKCLQVSSSVKGKSLPAPPSWKRVGHVAEPWISMRARYPETTEAEYYLFNYDGYNCIIIIIIIIIITQTKDIWKQNPEANISAQHGSKWRWICGNLFLNCSRISDPIVWWNFSNISHYGFSLFFLAPSHWI